MTSPSDVLALARAVLKHHDIFMGNVWACWFCKCPLQNHKPDCPVPIAQRVIDSEGR